MKSQIRRKRGLIRLKLFERDGGRCGICGELVDMSISPLEPNGPTIDHIRPKCRSGSNAWVNLQLAHERCNQKKGRHLPLLQYGGTQGRLLAHAY